MSSRTNPAYAELAYRKAILGEVVQLVRDRYTAAYGDDPEHEIISEDVFREDSTVPEGVIIAYIQELEREEADLGLELNRFEFVKREDEPVRKQAKKAPSKGRRQTRRQTRKGKGNGSSNQA